MRNAEVEIETENRETVLIHECERAQMRFQVAKLYFTKMSFVNAKEIKTHLQLLAVCSCGLVEPLETFVEPEELLNVNSERPVSASGNLFKTTTTTASTAASTTTTKTSTSTAKNYYYYCCYYYYYFYCHYYYYYYYYCHHHSSHSPLLPLLPPLLLHCCTAATAS